MPELVSVPEAAELLHLDPSRVRALASQGSLAAVRIGNRWAIERDAVIQRSRQHIPAGRPMSPHNAWGLLFLASDLDADWLSSKDRSRLRRALRLEGLESLAPRLRRRAEVQRVLAHPGELPYLLEDRDLVASGINAAPSLGVNLVAGREADGYVKASRLAKFRKVHALREVGPGERGNVVLRAVPDAAWHFESEIAPAGAVAVDLAEEADPRSRRAGQRLLRNLDPSRAELG